MNLKNLKHKNRLGVEEALEILSGGGMFILTDSEDRENEGDLVCAARFAGTDKINIMASKAKGLICCALEKSLCDRAGLRPLNDSTGPESLHGTRFCMPVDLIDGCTTGISAGDRSATVLRLASPDARPDDFARPGHMFPIMEADGGLDVRQGHTEATVALCRMAGLEGASVICEIMDDDGTMARMPRLEELAEEWNMGILTIEDLLAFRREAAEGAVRLPTEYGSFRMEFLAPPSGGGGMIPEPVCLVREPDEDSGEEHPDGPLVRIHSECLTGDLFGSRRCDCGRQLEEAQRLIEEDGRGYLIYLRQEGRGIGLRAKAAAYHLQDAGMDTLEANLHLGFPADSREYRSAAEYLKNKGVGRVRLLTNNPDKIRQLEDEGLRVTRVPLLISPDRENRRYMETKKERMGHLSA